MGPEWFAVLSVDMVGAEVCLRGIYYSPLFALRELCHNLHL
jgi:hypothetical protein